jgi:hypothetical protein
MMESLIPPRTKMVTPRARMTAVRLTLAAQAAHPQRVQASAAALLRAAAAESSRRAA